MIRRNLQVKINVDGLKKLSKSLEVLRTHSLYVGIPQGKPNDKRKEEKIRNSDLGWIHEKGSSDGRIPPRPFLEPSVRQHEGQIRDGFKSAIKAALADDEKAFKAIMTRTGIGTEIAVKEYIKDSDNFVPNAPSTLAKKFPKEKPLIDSGQLMNSITSILVKD